MTEQTIKIKTTTISLPVMASEVPGYKSRVVNLKFTPEQLDALYRLFHALNLSHEKLSSGRSVATPYQALQWFLEKVHEAIPPQPIAAARSKGLPGDGEFDDAIDL